MQERGFVQARSEERYWTGIKLVKSVSDFATVSRSEIDPPQDTEDAEET
jgi:hypothetical protein